MNVQSVDNSQSKISFGRGQSNLQAASTFVNMTDNQLRDIVYIADTKERKKSIKRDGKVVLGTFLAMPVVDTMARFILTKSGERTPLSLKAKAASRTAVGWGFCLATVCVYNALKAKAVKHSDSLDKFNQKHPVSSFITDMGIILGGLILGGMGINKIKSTYPEITEHLIQDGNKFFSKLDNTKFNKKTLPKLAEDAAVISKRTPTIAKIGRGALGGSVLILFGLGLTKLYLNAKHDRDRNELKYQQLKKEQNETAKYLVNRLEIEKEILAKKQKHLAHDLDKVMDATTKPLSKKEIADSGTSCCKDPKCCSK